MAELGTRLDDFVEMLKTSDDTGGSNPDVEVIIRDEDGIDYRIFDVKYDPGIGMITLEFNHDNEE
jgi:hypothetical protein